MSKAARVKNWLIVSMSVSLISSVLGGVVTARASESGVTAGEILLGSTGPLTGDSARHFRDFREGADLYFDQVNKTGGIFGRKIRVKVVDDGYEPQRTVENVRSLIETEKVFALFMSYGTPGSAAILPILEKHDVPLLCPLSSADLMTEPTRRNVFSIKPRASTEAAVLVKAAFATGVKDIALFYQDDAFGASGKQALQAALEKYGLNRKGEGSYRRNSVDVGPAWSEIKKAAPGAVAIWGVPGPAIAFIKLVHAEKPNLTFLVNTSAFSSGFEAQIAKLDADILISQSTPFYEESALPLVRDYSKAAGKGASSQGFEGYANAAFVIEALRRTGLNLSRESLRKSIEAMSDVTVGGLHLSFSSTNHLGSNTASVVRFQKGRIKPVK